MAIAHIIDQKVYIVDVLFSQENTNYTIPATVEKLEDLRANTMVWIESNGAGGEIANQIASKLGKHIIIPYHQSANKHMKILNHEGFVKKYFYFRNDYTAGSDYDLFMRSLFQYNKDKKLNTNIHDDAADNPKRIV